MPNVTALAKELLRRVAAAGRAERFQLRDVCPRDATAFHHPLEAMLDAGLVGRVVERVGVWHYRLTDAGRAAAASDAPPRLPTCRYE